MSNTINGAALKLHIMSKINHYEHMMAMGLILESAAKAKIEVLTEIVDLFNLEKIDEEITYHTEI
jgi:hypothetical protein